MNLSHISNAIMQKIPRAGQQSLRPGQIIQGEVLKLYPNNKAAIRLGNQRLIASLEVGLELGAKYHFQVTSNESNLKLRVLGEQLKQMETLNFSMLLKQLGLKENRANVHLLRSLTKFSVPFDRKELQQATELLRGEKNKTLATNVLLEMIGRKLPLNQTVFQSLLVSRKLTISEQLQAVVQQLTDRKTDQSNGDPATEKHVKQIETQLASSINKLIEQSGTFREVLIKEIASQNAASNQSLFRTLQGLGFIELGTDFSTWQKAWSDFTRNISASNSLGNVINMNLPFQLNEQDLIQVLSRIENQSTNFKQAVDQFMNEWQQRLQFHEFTGQPISRDSLTSLQMDLKATILPFLNQSQGTLLEQVPPSPQQLSSLYRGIQALSKEEQLLQLIALTKQAADQEKFLSLNPKQQFLEHLQQSTKMLGFDYENRFMAERSSDVLQSIKGMLLQLSVNQEAPEQHTKLLQLIQGIQLQSVNESPTFVQATLQLPAERLGLVKDLTLEFEGQKTEKGEIDPDYCRILFYLELDKLKETVIDVNIQQRAVSLTIFNNTEGLSLLTKSYKDKLSSNLETLNYHMTSLTIKKLEERQITSVNLEDNKMEKTRGVDFRI